MNHQELFDGNRGLAYRAGLRLCNRFRLQPADCDAVLSAALRGLWDAAKAFRPELGRAFATFGTACAHNAAVNELLQLRRWRPVGLADGTARSIPARPDSTPAELPAAVREAIARLDALSRAALLARHADGKTLGCVGAEMNLTGERVRQMVKKAIGRVRRELAIA